MLTVHMQQHSFSFSTHERIIMRKRWNFWDRKYLDPGGIWTANLRIHAECFTISATGTDISHSMFWNTGFGGFNEIYCIFVYNKSIPITECGLLRHSANTRAFGSRTVNRASRSACDIMHVWVYSCQNTLFTISKPYFPFFGSLIICNGWKEYCVVMRYGQTANPREVTGLCWPVMKGSFHRAWTFHQICF